MRRQVRRIYGFDFIGALWTQSFLRQVRHLRFIKGAVRFFYEGCHSYIGFAWCSFLQSSRTGSGRAGEILLLW
jgi:hypothetical protein